MCPSAHPSFYAFIITELIQQERTKNTKNLKINFNQIIKELSGYLINKEVYPLSICFSYNFYLISNLRNLCIIRQCIFCQHKFDLISLISNPNYICMKFPLMISPMRMFPIDMYIL